MPDKIDSKNTARWVAQYLNNGLAALSPQQIAILKAVDKKYKTDYTDFLVDLSKRFETKKGEILPERAELGAVVGETIDAVKGVSLNINKLLYSAGRPASMDEIMGLFSEIALVEQSFKSLIQLAEGDTQLQKDLDVVQTTTGLNLEQLSETHTMVERKIRGLVPPKGISEKLTGVKAAHPEIYGLGKEVGKGALGAFGIFGAIAGGIGSTVAGYAKRQKESRFLRESQTLAEKLTPLEESSPEYINKLREDITKGEPLTKGIRPEDLSEKRFRYGGRTSTVAENMTTPSGPKGSKLGSMFGLGSPQTKAAEVATGTNVLFNFFNDGAYKAKWTRELFSMFGGGKGAGEDKSGGLFGGIKDMLGKLRDFGGIISKALPVLGSALAIAGAAFIGWKAGRWIGEHLGVDKAIQGAVAKREESRVSSKLEAGMDPRARRAAELQREGLSPVAAAQRASYEFKNRPQYDISGKPIPGTEGTRYGGNKQQAMEKVTDLIPSTTRNQSKIENILPTLGDKFSEYQQSMLTKLDEVIKASQGSLKNFKKEDIFNIKDPLIENLNTGNLGVS